MAVPVEGVTRWFRDTNGKIHQINHVKKITFGTPLVARGTYRDEPPIIVGGACVVTAGGQTASITGGVAPTATAAPGGASASGDSSVLQSDSFTHEDLRYVWAPEPMVFFETTDTLATNPTGASFSVDRPTVPGGDFEVFDVDCAFSWGEDCAIWNVAPPGWSVGASA